MNLTRQGGHVVAEVLAENGITRVFGQDSPEWLFAVLDHEVFTVTITRDERSAGFAADAAARLTGVPAVACGIHGPGFTNLLTSLYEARESGSPVIALVSGIETSKKGRGAFQELDQIAAAAPIVKFAERVERPDRIAETLRRAIVAATSGRPGPVLVELPNDVMGELQPLEPSLAAAAKLSELHSATYSVPDGLLEVLTSARRPVVLLGGGARHVPHDVVARLAERLGAAACVTAMGRGAFPEMHPLYAGVVGFMTDRADGSGAIANVQMRDADLVLVIGSALDGVTTDGGRLPGSDSRIVHVDRLHSAPIEPRDGEMRVLADATEFLNAATTALGDEVGEQTSLRQQELAVAWAQVESAQRHQADAQSESILPSRLLVELQAHLRPDDLLVCDAAYSSVWALSYLRQGLHFADTVAGRGAGTLGFGLPAAIGASRAFPDRRVVALVGDGGFGFGWGELETIARLGSEVTCIVLNNSVFSYQRLWHELNGTQARNLDFAPVRHEQLAEAVGIRGIRVVAAGELSTALERGLASGPSVIDVVIDPTELPPFRKERHIGK
ncbi:thiamine pyrophosphate-binding protein [Leucobacter allii]|uniref:thiamine pyrophosphate-binding protein n=1 Tax=Leucobacter allii TaxID=2932247 RepID=UPI003D2724D9